MRTKSELRFGIAFVAVLCLFAVAAFAGAGALDGKSFQGQVGDKGKDHGDADTFLFKDGNFRSTACDKSASARPPTRATHAFRGHHAQHQGATMVWKGTVNGNSVEGTVVRTQGSGTPKELWFKGSLKP